MARDNDDVIVGTKAIAHELGVSEKTLGRWIGKGIVPAKKPGGQTSPARITRSALIALKARLNGGGRK